MCDIIRARSYLDQGFRCAVIKGQNVFVSDKRGIAPLIEMMDSGMDFSGGFAADKVVGKAAAFVYVKVGISTLYAKVLSKAAIAELDRANVNYEYEELTDGIRNRKGDGPCPMENTVKDIADVSKGIDALRRKVAELKANG